MARDREQDKILKKYFGWTNKDLRRHEKSHAEKIEDLSKPFWNDCERRPDGCLGCPNLRVCSNVSGYEARCAQKSEPGRMITWSYSLNRNEAVSAVRDTLVRRKSPSWCSLRRK